jgi:ribonuclease HI
MSEYVIIYTDGACKGNPGMGGWGVWLQYKHHRKELYGGEMSTTNNRMELMAAIQGLEALTRPCMVKLNTDSTYVLKGITEWLPNWKRHNWKTSHKKPVKNVDLWQRLSQVITQHKIEWIWVKGHSGDLGNEYADQLANRGIASLDFEI